VSAAAGGGDMDARHRRREERVRHRDSKPQVLYLFLARWFLECEQAPLRVLGRSLPRWFDINLDHHLHLEVGRGLAIRENTEASLRDFHAARRVLAAHAQVRTANGDLAAHVAQSERAPPRYRDQLWRRSAHGDKPVAALAAHRRAELGDARAGQELRSALRPLLREHGIRGHHQRAAPLARHAVEGHDGFTESTRDGDARAVLRNVIGAPRVEHGVRDLALAVALRERTDELRARAERRALAQFHRAPGGRAEARDAVEPREGNARAFGATDEAHRFGFRGDDRACLRDSGQLLDDLPAFVVVGYCDIECRANADIHPE
jgi:hypothetical protein